MSRAGAQAEHYATGLQRVAGCLNNRPADQELDCVKKVLAETEDQAVSMLIACELPLHNIRFVFNPEAKTAMIIRFDDMVAVPGRFDSPEDARAACLRVVRAQYVNAYTSADSD